MKGNQIQQREKAIAKLRKIKALAERGVGGEKLGAQKAYEELKAKFNITEAEIEDRAPQPKKRKEMEMTMAVLLWQIHEEEMQCADCPGKNEPDGFCETECGTRRNIKDLRQQFEQMAAELEGRQYAG